MAKPEADTADRAPLLRWLIFTGVWLFGLLLAWRFGLIRQMLAADRTYLSLLIVLFYGGAALHCLWRTIVVSREADATRRTAALFLRGGPRLVVSPDAVALDGVGALPRSLIADFIRDLAIKSGLQGGRPLDYTMLLRSFAGHLRGSNAFGAFAGDTLMKLGLIGTIIGFIMMLAPIAGLDTADRAAIKSSMNLMSEGMAVAMYTTLAGLVGSILVRVQYYMLESATAKLFSDSVALVDVHVVALLDRTTEAAE
ncbi:MULTISPECIES: MotA/TolQ/ExbB proton channel family protein [Rhodopseudomonas]|uniref:Biopolymer transporter ExbB n=1 Tax=Rhodopseudomonas palustris TaxID=1076 RepID=A0A0D7ETM4_RHOPL|nr:MULTISPECIES: MotA/TolQ/ExbB proton channel family protein [Rhodopseudomonas]KIZ42767.1 biopolymer transporter ExbB [Rhodopseudomonas palustris]MDF3813073.1 MotA/TolQ/ExbB proton channel family protein [Rhodopseudomonas sp. BAL398]WOK19253.1 MotA/TolQ/ExbB proton channel family protein [Rhodopseudomonas sp. BAL398]